MRRALAITLIAIAYGSIARAQSLDQQERCAQQAKRAYAETEAEFEAYNRAQTQKTVRFSGDYQSHYNVKLGKCLIAQPVVWKFASRGCVERRSRRGSLASFSRIAVRSSTHSPSFGAG